MHPSKALEKSLEHFGQIDPYRHLINMFSESWPSTALGFGGVGGQAFTDAYTVIIEDTYTLEFSVYFGGRFAYKVTDPNRIFYHDVQMHDMSKVLEHKARYAREQPNESE